MRERIVILWVAAVVGGHAGAAWADVVNSHPAADAVGVSTQPALEVQCSPIGVLAAQYQVAASPAFATALYDSAPSSNDVCAHVVDTALPGAAVLYWRARQQDATGWSAWSAPTSFTTLAAADIQTLTYVQGVDGYNGTHDTDIRGVYANLTGPGIREWDQAGQAILRFGRRPPSQPTDEVYRSLLRFDLTCLEGATIVNAWIELTAGEHGINPFAERLTAFYVVTRPWVGGTDITGTILDPGDVTWSHRDYPLTWQVPGVAGAGDRESTPAVLSVMTNDPGYRMAVSSADFVDAVRSWADDPSSNNGLIFQAVDESIQAVVNIRSSEYALASDRPHLVIQVTALPTGTPCDDGDPCTTDACSLAACVSVPLDCDDGLFCNGFETCVDGQGCANGIPPCSGLCDEDTDACVSCLDDADCDDGTFCNGEEACVGGSCAPGNAPECDDGVPCTVDACDAGRDACRHTADHAACDDGLFCTGEESCDVASGCEAGAPPCDPASCDETTASCASCLDSGDCDDGVFCNGAEACVGGSCMAGALPCSGLVCDETANACTSPPGGGGGGGGAPPPPPVGPPDSDGDGVADGTDLCPATLSGAAVDLGGCSAAQRDPDNDGVVNDDDDCPEIAGPVGNAGCPRDDGDPPIDDADGDAIEDEQDICPATPAGAAVDINGCAANQRDEDADGVTDDRDLCPATDAEAAVDDDGCPLDPTVDSDFDGIADHFDLCPRSPAAARVDHRGCSAVDPQTQEAPRGDTDATPPPSTGPCGAGMLPLFVAAGVFGRWSRRLDRGVCPRV